ncbi:MAG: Trigger factor [Candidatus Moranbacteria bacterium GW2011_GWE1_35_17]|nr:MAG: Trigger factor [Candidatus Moranbacteria bacterium GW2011_GWE1_35_17]KKP84466.1 MAG: Trigger factor [Candidatus Moranbacteria bacterium GW2011_GWF1_35_5]
MEIKKLPKSKVEFKLVIAWDNWKVFLDDAVQKISKEIKIEGFRPGKAPKKIVEQKVGKEVILNTAAEEAIKKNYPQKVKELNLDTIGSPEIDIIKLEEQVDLEFVVVASVMPEVELKKYKDEVSKLNKAFANEKTEIALEDILKELEKIAKSRAKLVTVRREAKKEDSIIIDFEVRKDGILIEGGLAKDHNLILGSEVFIPGFEDHLLGMKEGEEKNFELKFPKEYHEKNLAGGLAQFKVVIKLVQEREVPVINDEFAKSLGNFKDLEELKKNIEEGIKKEQEFRRQEKRRGEMMEILINKVELSDELPEILVHEEVHKMLHELESQIQQMGMSLADYVGQLGKTIDDLEKDWIPQAQKRIKAALALEKIIKEKEIKISSEEIEEAMNKTLQFYKNEKDAKDKIDMKRLFDYTNGILKNEEAFKMLEKM